MTHILVVEDDTSIAMALEDDLTLEGYSVTVTHTGNDAIRCASESAFDVIILDVMLPGKDGFEVCRTLRRAGVRVPVLMLTARTHEADKILGLELGADDYVTKPFSPAELRARVKALLRRSANGAPASYRFGDFEADFERFELRRSGAPVHVTPIEMKLLAAFIRQKGRALSRAALKDEVWGREAFMTDRVIDTHVANLRKKIEVDPADPAHVVSVRGVGYRFDS